MDQPPSLIERLNVLLEAWKQAVADGDHAAAERVAEAMEAISRALEVTPERGARVR
ncbi:MAG: hypothetical protein V4850_26235 [Myxococcota bacterium]